MNIVQTIRDQTALHFDKIAIIDGDLSITYRELFAWIDQLAAALSSRHITTGQRIAFHCADGIDYVVGALALLQCGAAVVPIADNVADSEARETIQRIDVHGVIRHAKLAHLPAEKIDARFYWFPNSATGESDEYCRAIGAAFIRFSSGTTGTSKGVVLSHQSIIDRTDAANQGLAVTSEDTILWVLSMSYHFVVSILLFLRRSATIVIGNQFFPFSLLTAASKHAITLIYASPVHYHLLSTSNAVSASGLSKVRLAISTSMKMPPEVSLQFLKKFNFAPAEAYGIIEIGLPFINTHPAEAPINSVGVALPDYQLKIDSPDSDGIGDVLIKGKGMFDAYFSPWMTRQSITQNGWFATGDLGRTDEQGRLFLLGRSKTVLICAGMKVFPEEVEQVINTLPGVEESLVLGRSHPQFGQVPVAQVVLSNDVSDPAAVLDQLRAFCSKPLSSYKVPVEFIQAVEIPKTPSGKIARKNT